MTSKTLQRLLPHNRLLIVDDDIVLGERLARVLEKRGYVPMVASSIQEAQAVIEGERIDYAVLDLKLDDGYGLSLLAVLKARHPEARVIMLTGYGNIATAVAAIKHGAVDYLSKPTDAESIDQALRNTTASVPLPESDPMSPDRVRWEHIQRVFNSCAQNVSETARRLKMHRRTLQRILAKHAPRV